MIQPLIGEDAGSAKACWSCAHTTPYNQGWCDDCWSSIPDAIQEIYAQTIFLPGLYGGLLRLAIADALRASLRPPLSRGADWASRHASRPKLTGLSLADLDLD